MLTPKRPAQAAQDLQRASEGRRRTNNCCTKKQQKKKKKKKTQQKYMISPFRGGFVCFCLIFFTFFCVSRCSNCWSADGPGEARCKSCAEWVGAKASAWLTCFTFSMPFFTSFLNFVVTYLWL